MKTCRRILLIALTAYAAAFVGCDQSSRHGASDQKPAEPPRNEPPSKPSLEVPAPLETPVPLFRDVASSSGIDFQFHADAVPGRYFLPEVMGGGVGWLDFDRDGRIDLHAIDGTPLDVVPADKARVASLPAGADALFRNLGGGRFADVAVRADADGSGYGQGIAVGDYDADGFSDIYLTGYGPNALLHNNGDGTFREAAESAGVTEDRWSTSCLWIDLDRDRLLDLFVANYMDVTPATHQICEYGGKPGYCGPGTYSGVPNRAFRNRGDGTFESVEASIGLLAAAGGKSLAVVAADFDEDLSPEIYVANDMEANFLFTLDADARETVRYREVAATSGCALSGDGMNEASMGIACGDFDADGRADLFLTHYYHAKNTLYKNLGGLIFDDQSRRSEIVAASYGSLGFGTGAGDFDRDGDLDLMVANGHVLGPQHEPNAMTPQVLTNDGTGRFRDVSAGAGKYFSEKMLGRGLAVADFDDDGDLDVAVSHIDRPLALLRNESARQGDFIGFRLVTADRIPPVGARLHVESDGRTWTVPVISGSSYLSSGDERIFVGLGKTSRAVSVAMHWPSGRVDRWDDLEVNRYWRLTDFDRPVEPDTPSRERQLDEL